MSDYDESNEYDESTSESDMTDATDSDSGTRKFPTPFDFNDFPPITLVELRMRFYSGKIRAKPLWWEKVHDEGIVAKWRAEIVENDGEMVARFWGGDKRTKEVMRNADVVSEMRRCCLRGRMPPPSPLRVGRVRERGRRRRRRARWGTSDDLAGRTRVGRSLGKRPENPRQRQKRTLSEPSDSDKHRRTS